jgi:Zn-dependent protease with chaperone function
MTAEDTKHERPPALTPARLVAAGTWWRFVLLLFLFVFGALAIWSYLLQDFSGESGEYTYCVLAAGLNPGIGATNYASILYGEPRNYAAFESCVARLFPDQFWLPLAITGGLVLAAFLLYWTFPWWKARGSRIVPLAEFAVSSAYSELPARLEALVSEAGITRAAPRFAVDPRTFTASAVVFGRRPGYTIVLDGGLVATYQSHPARFRAVMLHELAHVANRDVDITYAVVALWRVFLLGALLPAIAETIRDLAKHDHWAWSWGYGTNDIYYVVSLIFIAGLNYLSRADILRFREVAADVTAERWGADYGTWHAEPGGSQRERRALRQLRSFGAVWRTHPGWDARLRYVRNPFLLLAPDALTMFLTGAAAAVTAQQLASALPSGGYAGALFRALFAAGLITVIGGGALWRAVRDAVTSGRPVPASLRAGLWLGLGIAITEFLYGYYAPGPFPAQPELLVVLVVLTGLAFAWTAQIAELAAAARRRLSGTAPAIALAIGLAALWLLLGFVMYQWYNSWSEWLTAMPYSVPGMLQILGVSGSYLAHPGLLLSTQTVLLALSDNTLIGLWWVLPLLWLVPLALTYVRGAADRPRWLARAFAPGLAGGALACCAVFGVALAMNGVTPGGYLTTYLLMYVTWWEIVLGGAALATAVVTAAVARAYRLLSAMIAAATSVLIGLAGLYALLTFNGCAGPFNVIASSCHVQPTAAWPAIQITAGVALQLGVLAAGIAALCVLAIQGLTGKTTRPSTEHPGSGRRVAALAGVTGLLVVATITAFGAITGSAGVGDVGGGGSPSQAATILAGRESATPPASAPLVALQFLAWTVAGGSPIVIDIARDGETITSAFKTNPPSAAELTAGCASLADTISQADAYFTIPIAAGQQLWQQALDSVGQIASDCRNYQTSPTPQAAEAVGYAAVKALGPYANFASWFETQAKVPISP